MTLKCCQKKNNVQQSHRIQKALLILLLLIPNNNKIIFFFLNNQVEVSGKDLKSVKSRIQVVLKLFRLKLGTSEENLDFRSQIAF